MKLKGVYVSNIGAFTGKYAIGVEKKVREHIRVLSEFSNIYIDEDIANVNYLYMALLKMLPVIPFHYKWKYKGQYHKLDYIYLRYDSSDSFLAKFVKDIKEQEPHIKIVMEIPTYPYDMQRANNLRFYFYDKKDKKYREEVAKYVDRIITFSDDECIWGTPTIRTVNGINLKEVNEIKPVDKEPGRIDLIIVGAMYTRYGHERIIDGIKTYYDNGGKRKIIFHIVGDGPMRIAYQKLTKEKNINDNVVFYGLQKGEELDEIYNYADIGLDALANHRAGLALTSSLKSREYLAKGLPIVTVSEIDVLRDPSYKYCLRVAASDDEINIQNIVDFYDQIYGNESRESIINNIRTFAEKTVDMEITMKPIKDFLLKGRV